MSESKRDILERVKKATVAVAYISTANSDEPFTIVGSGFCIDPSGIVITCRHVVEAFMSKTIAQQITEAPPCTRPNGLQPVSLGNTVTPYAIFYDTARSSEHIFAILSHPRNLIAKIDRDLAAIQLLPHTSFPQGYPFLEIEEFGNISEGDEIGVCGFPLGNHLFKQLGTVTSSFTKGILSSIIPGPNIKLEYLRGFQLNVTATNGNSGGPVFSLGSGKAFGVLTLAVVHPGGGFVQGLVKAEPVYPVTEADFIQSLRNAPETMPR
jgi:S1-C subfamily serine protease